MKFILTSIVGILLMCHIQAQEWTYTIPNYKLIKEGISDSSSALYYSKLLTRLEALDTTLTNNDFRHLYYGYIYQANYKPYWTSDDEKKLLKYYRSETVKEEDYDEIIRLATHSIRAFPFDLRQMNYLCYIYHLKGDESMASKVSYMFNGIVRAILSSGNGKTSKTGYHVINVGHEYVILNLFSFQVNSQSLVDQCD